MNATDRASADPEFSAKHRIPAGYIFAAAIVAVIVLALVGRHLYYRSKINAELEAVHKAGFPVTLQELSDYYPVPQGQNAAYIYSYAFSYYVNEPEPSPGSGKAPLPVVGVGKLPPRGEPLPPEMQAAVSAYLASNAQALDLLHKAAAIRGCRYDVDLLNGVNTLLPHLAPVRQAARLLELQALIKVEQGNPEDAMAALEASFAVAHSLRNEPLLISQLVRIAVDSISVAALERVLSRTALTDDGLTDLSRRIAADDTPELFMRGMAGERCTGQSGFLSGIWRGALQTKPGAFQTKSDTAGSAVSWILYSLSGMEERDDLMYLNLMSDVVSIGAGTMKDMRERSIALDEKIAQVPKTCLFTRMLVPALTRASEEQLKSFARLRAARAGIAVERFRMANGRLPDSLDELVPKWLDAVPADPFDDKPIRYKKLTKGFVTYSVGPDLRDDGGREYDQKAYNAPYDITFIVAR
jgi:hypothetical protein